MEGEFIWWSLAFCFCFSWILSRQGNQWLGEQALPGVGWWWCVCVQAQASASWGSLWQDSLDPGGHLDLSHLLSAGWSFPLVRWPPLSVVKMTCEMGGLRAFLGDWTDLPLLTNKDAVFYGFSMACAHRLCREEKL